MNLVAARSVGRVPYHGNYSPTHAYLRIHSSAILGSPQHPVRARLLGFSCPFPLSACRPAPQGTPKPPEPNQTALPIPGEMAGCPRLVPYGCLSWPARATPSDDTLTR